MFHVKIIILQTMLEAKKKSLMRLKWFMEFVCDIRTGSKVLIYLKQHISGAFCKGRTVAASCT